MSPPVFRFAPSPNGYLHLGHAYSALLNSDRARETGGRLLLRIEDIDATRCRPEYETAIYEDLAWLGIAWETPVRRQSEHLDAYRTALDRLLALGLVYPAFESRAEIARLVKAREADGPWPRDPDGVPLYPGAARSLSADERDRLIDTGAPYALRLDMAAACRRAVGLSWNELGEGPDGERGVVPARPEAYELPSVRCCRRCAPGHQRDRAGPGPVPRHFGPPSASGSAPPARTRLPPPRATSRRARPEAVEINQLDRPS
jgi:glutamyl-Q tRNA(Asp) synthetase